MQEQNNPNNPQQPRGRKYGRHGRRFDQANPETPGQPTDTPAEGESRGARQHRYGRRGEGSFGSEWHDERAAEGAQGVSPEQREAWRASFQHNFGVLPEDHWIFGGRRFRPWHLGVDSFNPFVAALLSKGGGLLPVYALHQIARQPRYGNEIMELLAQQTSGQWLANPGAVYPLLNLLEAEGLIEGRWEDPEKRTIRMYRITPAGQAEAARIEQIVLPKLAETVQVLQTLIAALQTAPDGASEGL